MEDYSDPTSKNLEKIVALANDVGKLDTKEVVLLRDEKLFSEKVYPLITS